MQLRTIPLVALAAALGGACGPGPDQAPRSPRPSQVGLAATQQELDDAAEAFAEVRDGYLEWYFEAHPVRATELGVHDHDARLPAMDRAGVQRRIEMLLDWLAELEEIRFDFMRDADRYDYAVLEYGVRAELLELEEARGWANDPGVYIEVIARGLASVAEREFAPFAQRAGSLRGRLAAAPGVLAATRSNVRRPPRVWTELALADARGLLEYLERDLPALLREQGGHVPAPVESARAALVTALESHIGWMAGDLLPRSTGTYRMGRYLLERRLLYGDHVSLSLDELERLNTRAISEYRSRIAEVAEGIDPNRTPRAILDSISRVGPAPDALLDRARETLVTARDWAVSSGIVAVKDTTLPVVRASPPYARAAFSSLDAPGPFETGDPAAFYNLTNAREAWGEELMAEHLTYFSDAGLMLTTLYETFPGHLVQEQYARELSDLRRVISTRAVTAGWAHYAAEVAVDEGVSDDPAVRLEQLRRALQRHARWYAVVRLHAMQEPMDQVVAAFQEIAYFEEFPARREVLRATRDPGLMADALGRMQIQELRDAYREHLTERDETFDLAEFHQRLLSLGLPFPLAREVMIPGSDDRPGAR